MRLEHIKKDEDRLVARIISNNFRRRAPRKGKEKMLGSQGQIFLIEGIEPRKIAYRIAEETGMGYQRVTKYLPERCRDASMRALCRQRFILCSIVIFRNIWMEKA